MTQPTMEEVVGWLREVSEEKYREWAEFRGHDRFAKAEMWANRATQVEAMGWRPIDEAPKDGTHFIGLVGGLVCDVHCREGIDGWKENGKGGWVESGKNNHRFYKETDDSIMPCNPTHWIPLPPPPVTK